MILLAALGGMAAQGILGMFAGAALLAVGYQIFMGWVGEAFCGETNAPRQEAKETGPTLTFWNLVLLWVHLGHGRRR